MPVHSPHHRTLAHENSPESKTAYYPGTDKLKANEMRVISCGTGLPLPMEHQAGSCWLVELGNGQKFIFDIGSGSLEAIAGLHIPYNELDKVFLTHLHVDHVGDFEELYIEGWLAGRAGPLKVWGPSGSDETLGTRHAIQSYAEAMRWDITSRKGRIPDPGRKLEIHEFDYQKKNHIVYENNGVVIRSWPAIHVIDGPTSYSLEWNGLKFVYSGDSRPNKWFLRYAKDADIAIHEAFNTLGQLVELHKHPPSVAKLVGTHIHTHPAAFGTIMEQLDPRMAVAFHFVNTYGTHDEVLEQIRSAYEGPLTLASDKQVWKISPKEITVKEAIINPSGWPAHPTEKLPSPNPNLRIYPSEEIKKGKLDVSDAVKPYLEQFNRHYGDSTTKNPK